MTPWQEQTALLVDDEAFSDDLRRFLAERFPEPCLYERTETTGLPT